MWEIVLLQHFERFLRLQHEVTMAGSGSDRAFAVPSVNDDSSPKRSQTSGAAPKMLLVRNSMVTFPEADPRQGQAASRTAAG